MKNRRMSYLRKLVCLVLVLALTLQDCPGLFTVLVDAVSVKADTTDSGIGGVGSNTTELHGIASQTKEGFSTRGATFYFNTEKSADPQGYTQKLRDELGVGESDIATVWFTGSDWGGTNGPSEMPNEIALLLVDRLVELAISSDNGVGKPADCTAAIDKLRDTAADSIALKCDWQVVTTYDLVTDQGSATYSLSYNKTKKVYELIDFNRRVPKMMYGKQTLALKSMESRLVDPSEVTEYIVNDRNTFLWTINPLSQILEAKKGFFQYKKGIMTGWSETTVEWADARYDKPVSIHWPNYTVEVVYTNCAECAKGGAKNGVDQCPHCHQTFWKEQMAEGVNPVTISAENVATTEASNQSQPSDWIWESKADQFNAVKKNIVHGGVKYYPSLDGGSIKYSWKGKDNGVYTGATDPVLQPNDYVKEQDNIESYALSGVSGDVTLYLQYEAPICDVSVNYVYGSSVVGTKSAALISGLTSSADWINNRIDLDIPAGLKGDYTLADGTVDTYDDWTKYSSFLSASPTGYKSALTPVSTGGSEFYVKKTISDKQMTINVAVDVRPKSVPVRISYEAGSTVIFTKDAEPPVKNSNLTYPGGNIYSSVYGGAAELAGITSDSAAYGYEISGTTVTYEFKSPSKKGTLTLSQTMADLPMQKAEELIIHVPVKKISNPVNVRLVCYTGKSVLYTSLPDMLPKGSTYNIASALAIARSTSGLAGYRFTGKVDLIYSDSKNLHNYGYDYVPTGKKYVVSDVGMGTHVIAHDSKEAKYLYVYAEAEELESLPVYFKYITAEDRSAVSNYIGEPVAKLKAGQNLQIASVVSGHLASDAKLAGYSTLGKVVIVYGSSTIRQKQLSTVLRKPADYGVRNEGWIVTQTALPTDYTIACGSDECEACIVYVFVSQTSVPVTVKYIAGEAASATYTHNKAVRAAYGSTFNITDIIREDLRNVSSLSGYRVSASSASNISYVYGVYGTNTTQGTAAHTLELLRGRLSDHSGGTCYVNAIDDGTYLDASKNRYTLRDMSSSCGWNSVKADHLTVFVKIEPAPEKKVPVSIKYISSASSSALYKRLNYMAEHKPGTSLDLTSVIASDMASQAALKRYTAESIYVVYGMYGTNTTQGVYAHQLNTLINGTQGGCCTAVGVDEEPVAPFITRTSAEEGEEGCFDHICVFVYVREPDPSRMNLTIKYITYAGVSSASVQPSFSHTGTLSVLPGDAVSLSGYITQDLAAHNTSSSIWSRTKSDKVYIAYGSGISSTHISTLLNNASSHVGSITTLTGETSGLGFTVEGRSGANELVVWVVCSSSSVTDFYRGIICYMNQNGSKCIRSSTMSRVNGTDSSKIYPGMYFNYELESSLTSGTKIYTPEWIECYVSKQQVSSSDDAVSRYGRSYSLMNDEIWMGVAAGTLNEWFVHDGRLELYVEDYPAGSAQDYGPSSYPYYIVYIFCKEQDPATELKVVYIDGESDPLNPDILYTETYKDAFATGSPYAGIPYITPDRGCDGTEWTGIYLYLKNSTVKKYLKIDSDTWWNSIDLPTTTVKYCSGYETRSRSQYDYPGTDLKQEIEYYCVRCGAGITHTWYYYNSPQYHLPGSHEENYSYTVNSYNATTLKAAWAYGSSLDASANQTVLSKGYSACTKQSTFAAGQIAFLNSTTLCVMYKPYNTISGTYAYARNGVSQAEMPTSMILYIPMTREKAKMPVGPKTIIKAYDVATGEIIDTITDTYPPGYEYEFELPEVIEVGAGASAETYMPEQGEVLSLCGMDACDHEVSLTVDISHAEVCPTCGGKGYVSCTKNNRGYGIPADEAHYQATGHYPVINVSSVLPRTSESNVYVDYINAQGYPGSRRTTVTEEFAVYYCSICGQICGQKDYYSCYGTDNPNINEGTYELCPTCTTSGWCAGLPTSGAYFCSPGRWSAPYSFSGYRTWPVFYGYCDCCGARPITALEFTVRNYSTGSKQARAMVPLRALAGGTNAYIGYVLPSGSHKCGALRLTPMNYTQARTKAASFTRVAASFDPSSATGTVTIPNNKTGSSIWYDTLVVFVPYGKSIPELTPPPTNHGTNISKAPSAERVAYASVTTSREITPSETTVTGLFYNPSYPIEDGYLTLPAGTSVYGSVTAPAYRAGYTYRTVTGQKKYTITYTYTYDYSVPYVRGNGVSTPRCIHNVGPLSFTVDVIRDYTYVEITGAEVEYLSGAQLVNSALPRAISLSLSNCAGGASPGGASQNPQSAENYRFTLTRTANHLTEPSYTTTVNLGNIGTKSAEFYLNPADYVNDAESRVGPIRCASDTLTFGGAAILSGAGSNGCGAQPQAIPEPPMITLNGVYTVIDANKPNGRYETEPLSAQATYSKVVLSADGSSTRSSMSVRFTPSDGIHIHTPVTCYATIIGDNDRYVQTEVFLPSDSATVNVVLNPGITVAGQPAEYGQETNTFKIRVSTEAQYSFVRFSSRVELLCGGVGASGVPLADSTWYRIRPDTDYKLSVPFDTSEETYSIDLISFNSLRNIDGIHLETYPILPTTGSLTAMGSADHTAVQNTVTEAFMRDSAYQTNSDSDKNAARDTKNIRVSGSISRFEANDHHTSELPLTDGKDRIWSNLGSLVKGDSAQIVFTAVGSVAAEPGSEIRVIPSLYYIDGNGVRTRAEMYCIEQTGASARLVRKDPAALVDDMKIILPPEFFISSEGTDVYGLLASADYAQSLHELLPDPDTLILHLDIELWRRENGILKKYMTYANETNEPRGAGNMWKLEGFISSQIDTHAKRYMFTPGDIAIIDMSRSVLDGYGVSHLFY